MTKEEAITNLNMISIAFVEPITKEQRKLIDDTFDMAIKALEQESCDCISRKSLKHKLQEHHDFFVNAYGGFSNLPPNDKARVDEITNCIAMVVNEPSIQPKPKTECSCEQIKWERDIAIEQLHELGYELGQKIEPCEDCISRKAVLDALNKWDWQELYLPVHFKDIIDDLPSIQPQPKTGHWIVQPSNKEQGERDFIWWKCSECGQVIYSETEKDRKEFHAFCSRCGVKMIEPQESEDKE